MTGDVRDTRVSRYLPSQSMLGTSLVCRYTILSLLLPYLHEEDFTSFSISHDHENPLEQKVIKFVYLDTLAPRRLTSQQRCLTKHDAMTRGDGSVITTLRVSTGCPYTVLVYMYSNHNLDDFRTL